MNLTGESIGVVVSTVAVFSAMMYGLTMPNKTSKKLLGLLASLSIVGALLMYGYGYGYSVAAGKTDFLAAVFRAVFASIRIFGGYNAWGDVAAAYPNLPEQALFWLIHLMGLFTAAGALLKTLGAVPLRHVQMYLVRQKEVALIYGLNQRTLDFGRTLGGKDTFVVYVDPKPDLDLSRTAEQMGAICFSDESALEADVRFLKSMGVRPGVGTIRLYALSRDQLGDRRYARSLVRSLEARGIGPEQTGLTILGPEDETENAFQSREGFYGYGTVNSVNEPELAARVLVRNYPPCNHVSFNDQGLAESDFQGLIVGFGLVGQAVLRQLVMNGQFHGSRFRVDVFDPSCEQVMGKLACDCAPMLEHYDIRFHPHDGRSRQMYSHITEHSEKLKYIVLCSGDPELNYELGRQLYGFLTHLGCGASVYYCTKNGVSHMVDLEQMENHLLYVPELLCTDLMDRRAMTIHHSYIQTGDIRENWRACSYFHRMSNRAAADFHPALLRIGGSTPEAARELWAPEGELMENLARTEHLRWVAFHYAMGFRPMTTEEMKHRALLLEQGKVTGKVNQDLARRIHACMVPWEELDALSELQSRLSGKAVDHKEADRSSVRTVSAVLRSMES